MCKSSANVDGTRNFAIKLFGATISVSVCDDFSQEESSSRKRPAPAEEASKIESLCERGAKSLKIIENLEETASKIENLSHGGPKSLKMNENIEEKGSKVESLSGRGAKSLKMTESIEEKSEISCSIDKGEESLKSVTAGDVKSLPKPEKPVPCPRCHSVETKFCYFNNYNVNQPRHFCKNCRRYWTAGGSMRNIPVGAGRRKSKHFSTFQLSKSMDLQESKVKYENFDESIHQTPGIFSTGDESVVSKNPCVEEIEGSNSVGFMNPMVAAGFANLMDPASTIDGTGTENSTPWIQKLQQSGNSNNILNCLVLHGRPLSTKLHTK